jgi:hypothetical protein
MEIQHTGKRRYMAGNLETDKLTHRQPFMKQLIFWIMIVLALICVVAFGMIVINYTMNAKL